MKNMMLVFLRKLFGVDSLLKAMDKDKEQLLLAIGKLTELQYPVENKIPDLSSVEFKIFSQWGDDGIIAWIFKNIQTEAPFFIEFGVQTYQESNTRYLLQSKNWEGLIIDGDIDFINYIKNDEIYWKHSLKVINAFITKENVNELLKTNSSKREVDLLSIDIDGNDYWIFKEICSVNPKVIICEYNSIFGNDLSVTTPYSSNFIRNKQHYSNLYFGSSIKALIDVAEEKGYEFIGTNSNGNNAYFVRKDLAEPLMTKIETKRIFNSKFRERRDKNNKLNPQQSREEALMTIKDLILIDTNSGKEIKIENLYFKEN